MQMNQAEEDLILAKCERVEKHFIKLIRDFKEQKEEAKKALQQSKEAVMFIGDTGSGKSTLVNWLNGAKFDVLETYRGDCILEMSEGQETKFSKTGSGIKSIALYPNYVFNEQHNILTIDFPGFRNTRGWLEQLFIKMMYMDLVNRFSTKFVVVVEQPTMEQQARGSSLQELVKTAFQPKEGAQINSICLILNQFIEGENKIKKLISSFKLDFDDMRKNGEQNYEKQIYEAFKQNIQVVQKIESEEDYQNIFSVDNRENLWQAIKKTQPIKIQVNKLENSEEIGQYLQTYSDHYISQIQNALKNALTLENLEKKQNDALQKISQLLGQQANQLNKEKTLKSLSQTIDFLKGFGKIAQIQDKQIRQIEINFKPLFEIFEFFEEYGPFIKCFPEVRQKVTTLFEYFSQHLKSVQQQLQKKGQEQIYESKLNQQKQENEELKQQQAKIYKDVFKTQQDQIKDKLLQVYEQQKIEQQNQNEKQELDKIENQKKIKNDELREAEKCIAILTSLCTKAKKGSGTFTTYERSAEEQSSYIECQAKLKSLIKSVLLKDEADKYGKQLTQLMRDIDYYSKPK